MYLDESCFSEHIPNRFCHHEIPQNDLPLLPEGQDLGLQGVVGDRSGVFHDDKTCSEYVRKNRIRQDTSRKVAEGVGFEPTERLPVHSISSRAP